MPAKFKESSVKMVNRRKVGMVHYYLRNTSTDELVEAVLKSSTRPKHKQKYRNELVKRGFDLGLINE
jgi:hypothetical protein